MLLKVFITQLFFYGSLIQLVFAANVTLIVTTSNTSVIVSNTYNITISRNVSSTGATIIPSSVGTPMLITVQFASEYDLSGASISTLPATIYPSNNSIFINTTESNQIKFTINNVSNPLPSQTDLKIFANIMNNNSVIIDFAETTKKFNSLALTNTTWKLQTGNVSTLSNLTFTLSPLTWNTSTMTLRLIIWQYWTRALLNSTSTQILPLSATCQPACTITRRTNFSQVTFRSLTFLNSLITIKIKDINSPPTLQPIDSIQISTFQSTYNSVVQTDLVYLSSIYPNYPQALTVSTTSLIKAPVQLRINITTRDIFGPNDTINLALGSQLLTSATITITSSLIISYTTQIPTNSTIKISSFALITNNYNRLSAIINIVGIANQESVKPISNNSITYQRNGYSYNTGQFTFAALAQQMNNITMTLNNNFANSNATCLIRLNFTTNIQSGNLVFLKVPSDIIVYNCSAQCTNCFCTLTAATQTDLYYYLRYSNFSTTYTQLVLSLNVKNPISTNYTIQACSTDSQNYTIECGNQVYPNVSQANLDALTLTLLMSSQSVYAISNYTIIVNMTNFDLQIGFLIIEFPTNIQLANSSSTVICKINGQAQCLVTVSPLKINVTAGPQTKIYTVIINNIRNPQSTQPFNLVAKFLNSANAVYYSIRSDFYKATIPYTLTITNISTATCLNSASNNTVSLTFNLPFETTGIAMGVNNQLSQNFTNPLVFSIRNIDSFSPTTYTGKILTSDSVYEIFQFSFTLTNCDPTKLTLTYDFSGLPQDSGTLNFAFSRVYDIDSLTIKFPGQYPQNISVLSTLPVSLLSPRLFNLTLNVTGSPITVSVWNYTNPLSSTYFTITTYKNSYIVSQNNDTIKYTSPSSCVFPCKICSNSNSSLCIQCYSSVLTTNYLLNDLTDTCVTSCASGTYLMTTEPKCVGCPSQCSICSNSTYCSKCASNYYLFNNSCLTDCPTTYYPITTTQICSLCTSPCNQCVSSTICLTCISSYYLTDNGTCVLNCPTLYIQLENFCRKCQTPCQTCTGTLYNCTTCPSGIYLYQNTCVASCITPQIGYNGSCRSCSSNCLTCLTTPSNCVSCSSSLILYGSVCVSSCPSGTYSNSSVCLTCSSECVQCVSLTNCSTCTSNFVKYLNSCLINCPLGFFNSSGVCRQCSTSCLQCVNSSYCTFCANNTYLKSLLCVTSCPISMLGIGGKCQACPIGCSSCVSLTVCDACLDTYSLYLDACITTCPANTTNINKVCRSCQNIFSNCITCSNLTCTACNTGFLVGNNGLCITTCPVGQVNISGVCKSCSVGCSECTSTQSNCISCVTGYNFYSNTCIQICPYPLISFSQQCVSCTSPCATCLTKPTTCLSCIEGTFYYDNQCLQACPTGFYGTLKVCQPCETGCQNCDNLGCIQCYGNMLHDLPDSSNRYNCYSTCPAHLPFVINQTLCSLCSKNCLSCSNEQCLICSNGYYRYGNYCVLTCPAGYIATAETCTNDTSIPVDNNTTNTTNTTTSNTQTTTQSKPIRAPMPFTIVLFLAVILVFISKIQNTNTSILLAIYGLASIVTAICNLYHLGILWPQYLILTSVILMYCFNIAFIFASFFTLNVDQRFNDWKQKRNCWWYFTLFLCLITLHTYYCLVFSQLFNLMLFKAHLSTTKNIWWLNFIWGANLICFLLPIIGAIVGLVNQFDIAYIDLMIVNIFMLILGVVLLNKRKDQWQWNQQFQQSTENLQSKKVIFDEDSRANLNKVDNQYGVKGSNTSIKQQYYENQFRIDPLLDILITPDEMHPPIHERFDQDHDSVNISERANNQKVLQLQSDKQLDPNSKVFQSPTQDDKQTQNYKTEDDQIISNQAENSQQKPQGQINSGQDLPSNQKIVKSKTSQRKRSLKGKQRTSWSRASSQLNKVTEEDHQEQEQLTLRKKAQSQEKKSLTKSIKSSPKSLTKSIKSSPKSLSKKSLNLSSKKDKSISQRSLKLSPRKSQKISQKKSDMLKSKSQISRQSGQILSKNSTIKSIKQSSLIQPTQLVKQELQYQIQQQKIDLSHYQEIKLQDSQKNPKIPSILKQQEPLKIDQSLQLLKNIERPKIIHNRQNKTQGRNRKNHKTIDNKRYSDRKSSKPFKFEKLEPRISGMHTMFIQSDKQDSESSSLDYDNQNGFQTINPINRLDSRNQSLPQVPKIDKKDYSLRKDKRFASKAQLKPLQISKLARQIERKQRIKKQASQLKNIYLKK